VFPRDVVCLRNISINTLHKGDDNDNNNNNNNNVTQYNFYFIEPFLIPVPETASFNKAKLNIIPSTTYFADCDGE